MEAVATEVSRDVEYDVTVTGHEVNEFNAAISIKADAPTHGNASHEYYINWPGSEKICDAHISFQKGPIAEHGMNGLSNEVLLAIVRHRLQGFQSSSYSCRENALALTKIEEALHWLHHRTLERMSRNVEGTHKV